MNDRPQTGCSTRGFAQSAAHHAAARRHLARGVSSTARAAQRPVPVVVESAEGAWITDADSNRFIDYAMGYGPLILGHSPAPVLAAIRADLDRGLRTASNHRGEAELADLIAACVPSAELSTFVSTGSEAVQLALRIARAATGRLTVVKFRANYHGWFDSVSVANTPGNDGPAVPGQDPHAAESLTVLDWGDADALERVLDDTYAAVLMEPAAINAGCFAPPAGFLARVREATRRHGVMLIFDEVITGFRMALGGAQAYYGVLPDLSVLGKALGGGLPIGAVCGTRAAMQPVESGRMSHRGTFNGQSLAVAAGIACLKLLQAEGHVLFPRMERFAVRLAEHVNTVAARLDAEILAQQVGPALQVFAGVRSLAGLHELGRVDTAATLAFSEALLYRGVHAIPRGVMYLSSAHGEAEIEATLAALTGAIAEFGESHG
jgi:glutamate-1-semialdehyde 2,1-aminomutase